MKKMVNVAVLGYGTVGSGVVEVIKTNKAIVDKKAGQEINVKYVLDLREFPGDSVMDILVHDYNDILNDPEVEVIAEVMGGVEPAYTFVKAALEKGKSVCTSNKELVAKKGAELLAIAKEKNCNFFFEASVGGAIPIIRPLHKCLAAVALASVLMVLYVTIRFKKIGGLSAGVMALVALFHDIAMIYFLYVIFQMPIDSNFIAVVLMILGYSLNDTIVIYDRVREQRKLMGRKTDVGTVFNVSCTKTLKRTIMTSVTTLSAIMAVYILAFIFNINSVKSFALPMMIGVISGCYSSICIAGPLWVMWQNKKAARKAAKKA